jgi:hypothetical protein
MAISRGSVNRTAPAVAALRAGELAMILPENRRTKDASVTSGVTAKPHRRNDRGAALEKYFA